MKTSVPYPALLLSIALLILANGFTFAYALKPEPAPMLTVAFLDVGQGDAIYIKGPTGIDVLIDGGKDRSVLRELPKVMGPLDRTLDVVVATHPDADHIGGLPDVLERYRVSYILESGRIGDSSQSDRLEALQAKEQGLTEIVARKDMRIHLGGGAYADVLHPEDNVAKLPGTNDASVILRLVFGDTEFMLTGDAPSWVETRLVTEYGEKLRSDVLKAGHHGSKTSTSEAWLDVVDPQVVVVSAGKDNSYGHPHGEVLDRIKASGASVLSTIDSGTSIFASDGKSLERR